MFQLSGGMYSQNALVLSPFLAGVSAVVTLVSSVSYSVFGISMAQYLGDLFPVLESYQVPVVVFPLPAPARISTGPRVWKTACRCMGLMREKYFSMALRRSPA